MPDPAPKLPRVIGGYELISRVGQGAMGSVFKARQVTLDRIVALKILPPSIAKDAEYIDRFQREARASAKLNHPNIVQGIDVGRDEAANLWYFAMEYVDGPTLRQLVKEQKSIPERRALEIARDMARALECAQKQGIVHRDVKPDNILVNSRGEAKLADLGLAKQTKEDASLTQVGQAVGTPHYMAPEQARGATDQFDTRTDIYALGATLYHLVTGQTPFKAETSAAVMAMHLTEKVPLAHRTSAQVSEGFGRLIARMMAKEREQRVQTPADLLREIERLLNPQNTTGPRQPIRGATTGKLPPVRPGGRVLGEEPRPVERVRSGSALPLIAAGGILLLAVGVAMLW